MKKLYVTAKAAWVHISNVIKQGDAKDTGLNRITYMKFKFL